MINPLKWLNRANNLQVREIKLKAETSTKAENVLTQIIERANARSRKDFKDWRMALQAAENPELPKRFWLYHLYAELVLDTHYSGVWENGRKQKVLAEPFRIIDDVTGKEDAALTKAFNQSWFYEFVCLALDSKQWGHSLIQFTGTEINNKCEIELVPRRHVKPEFGEVVKEQFDDRGFSYRKGDIANWVLEVGDKRDLGLLSKAAPHLLIKKNAMQAWSEFAEVFGMPMRKGTVPSRNQHDIDRMERALKEMGRAAYAVLLDGETLDFVETVRTDAYLVYDELINRCNSEISKLILGNTMTTDVGANGSRAQAEVHERVSDAVLEADKRFVTALCREKLFPFLLIHGWTLEGKSFGYVQAKDVAGAFDRAIKSQQYFEVDEKWWGETFGIPVRRKEKSA